MTRIRGNARLLAGVLLAAAIVVALLVWSPWSDEGSTGPEPAAAAPADGVTPLRSRTDLRPPRVAIDTAPERPTADRVFLSPRMEERERDGATHQQGALVLDDQGRTLWFRPGAPGQPITDVRPQVYDGEPVLTWWEGAMVELGIGSGRGVIVNRSYDTVATVEAGNGEAADLHEFKLTPRGTALLTIYSRARRDLAAMGGERDAQVTQGIVQEVDVETGEVLFEWESLDEVAPEESHRPLPEEPDASYDYFHINSVDENEDGDFLVSARNTSAVYEVDRETGRLNWRLGGERSDFEMPPDARFGLQHDARYMPGGIVQIFDNADQAGEGERQSPSRVIRLRLDAERMRASLVDEFPQPDAIWAQSQGNALTMPDGGVMTGWGSTGAFTRFDAQGNVLLDGHLPAEFDSYRAYMGPWEGRPDTEPAIHVRREKEQVSVAASWNGATGVDAWQVLAGPSPEDLEPLGAPARWAGLETVTVRATPERFVAVAALDADGRRLATSQPARIPPPPPPPE